MRIGIVGGYGMSGGEVANILHGAGHKVFVYGRESLDVTNFDEIMMCDWMINCAAYTQVDLAEKEPTMAYDVNAVGAGKLARICKSKNIKFVHISTDYVFDGKMLPWESYEEESYTNPINLYGKSKELGEFLVRKELPTALIVRTQGLYGNGGSHFIKAILKKVNDGAQELTVVDDQFTCPTYTKDVAVALQKLIEGNHEGTFHVSSSGSCSWNEFAKEVLKRVDREDVSVKGCNSMELLVQGRAVRPYNSVLDCSKYEKAVGCKMPKWEDALVEFLKVMEK